jgi:hypothetical protein
MFIYSPLDNTVDAKETERQITRFGSQVKEVFRVDERVNEANHVLAGELLAPHYTATIKAVIFNFLSRLT